MGLIALGLLLCGWRTPLALATEPPPDRAIEAARDAYRAGDEARLADLEPALAEHLLAPYVAFWRLQLRLETASPSEVSDFLALHADTPMAEELREDWLLLTGERGEWDRFLEAYPPQGTGDPEVEAYALQARWRRDGVLVPAAVRPYWEAPAALPQGLIPLVDELFARGDWTSGDLRQRFRRLVRAGLLTEARTLAERFPAGEALTSDRISGALRDPEGFLKASPPLETALQRDVAMAAVTRLARKDPQAAAAFWEGPLAEGFSAAERADFWGFIAEWGARYRRAEALAWYARAGDTPLTDEALAWRVRIALRQQAWPEVIAAIGTMSPAGAADPAWIYWRGRALLATGADREGRKALGKIAGQPHFYGLLAAEELGIPLEIPPPASPPTAEERALVASLPGLQRALALYRLGLRSEGTREWNWALRGMDDRSLLAAADLAHRHEVWDRAIHTANRTLASHNYTLRYPTPYREVLARHARNQNLEEPLVLGLVRRESRFVEEARSRVGASGLMQLMPRTARWVARRSGLKGFHPSRVNHPEVNVALGTSYLRYVLDQLGGDAVLAAAAYNAGPGRAVDWLGDRPLEGAIFIESIPFAETRLYVKKVMTNAVYYAALHGGERRSLKARLGVVAAAGSLVGGDGP